MEGLARRTYRGRFAWDAYRRFVQMYLTVVSGLPKEELEGRLRAMKERLKIEDDTQVAAEDWQSLVAVNKDFFKEKERPSFSRRSRGATLGRHRRRI